MACGSNIGWRRWPHRRLLKLILNDRFYNDRRAQLAEPAIQPNAAHQALVTLEKACEGEFLLVTQNVDDLHQRAGTRNIVPMHGQLRQARCLRTGEISDVATDLDSSNTCICCQPPSPMRPNIVWFGEIPLQMDRIQQALCQADLFIAIGTSGQVYPAAGFAALAAECGAHTVELNLEKTGGAFEQGFYGKATEVVPDFINRLLGGADVG